VIYGDRGNDAIYAGFGNDTVYALAGSDTIEAAGRPTSSMPASTKRAAARRPIAT